MLPCFILNWCELFNVPFSWSRIYKKKFQCWKYRLWFGYFFFFFLTFVNSVSSSVSIILLFPIQRKDSKSDADCFLMTMRRLATRYQIFFRFPKFWNTKLSFGWPIFGGSLGRGRLEGVAHSCPKCNGPHLTTSISRIISPFNGPVAKSVDSVVDNWVGALWRGLYR